MAVISESIPLETRGHDDIIDITETVARRLAETGIRKGIVNIFIGGATGGITTLEAEPGAVADLKACFERLAPREITYQHNEAYHDGNGHSHVRAALMGPSLTVPVEKSRMTLGTWQKIVFVDFDNRPRQRTIQIHCVGE